MQSIDSQYDYDMLVEEIAENVEEMAKQLIEEGHTYLDGGDGRHEAFDSVEIEEVYEPLDILRFTYAEDAPNYIEGDLSERLAKLARHAFKQDVFEVLNG